MTAERIARRLEAPAGRASNGENDDAHGCEDGGAACGDGAPSRPWTMAARPRSSAETARHVEKRSSRTREGKAGDRAEALGDEPSLLGPDGIRNARASPSRSFEFAPMSRASLHSMIRQRRSIVGRLRCAFRCCVFRQSFRYRRLVSMLDDARSCVFSSRFGGVFWPHSRHGRVRLTVFLCVCRRIHTVPKLPIMDNPLRGSGGGTQT